MSSDQPSEWQKRYQEALLELDPARLLERIDQAYESIQRCMDLTLSNSNSTQRQVFADALANLRVLRREAPPAASNADSQWIKPPAV